MPLFFKKYPDLTGFNLNKELIVNRIKHSFLLYFLLKIKGIITLPILVALLDAEGIGKYRLIFTTASVLIPILSINLSDGSAIFFVNESDKAKIRDKFYSIFFVSFIFMSITCVAGLIITYFYYINYFIDVALTVFLVFASFFLKFGIFLPQVYQKTAFLLKSTFFSEYLSFAASAILIMLTGMNYIAAVIGQGLILAILSFFLFDIIYHNIGFSLKINKSFINHALRISIPLMPVFLSQWIMQCLANFFIAYFSNTAQVGIYSVAYSICSLIAALLTILNMIWPSTSVKLWSEDKKKYGKFFNIFFSGIYAVMGFVFLFFYLNSFALIDLFSNKNFYAAAEILPLTSLSFILMVLIKIFDCAIYANKNVILSFMGFSSGAVLSCVLNFFFIPRWNIHGAAASTAISYALTFIFCFITVTAKLKIKIYLAPIIKTSLLTLCMIIFIYVFKLNRLPYITIIILNIILLTAYFGMAFLAKIFTVRDIMLLSSIMPANKFFNFLFRRRRDENSDSK